MKSANLLTKNLIIGVTNDSKNYQRIQAIKKTLQGFGTGKKIQKVSAANNQRSEEKSILTEELKTRIRATFDRLVYRVMEEIAEELDYQPYDDEDKLIAEAEERVKEKIANNFEDYNSWIGDDENYEVNKAEIINFINQL